jgi:hypothetical protein
MLGGGEDGIGRTMAAILHTSVLAPHFAPRITSGDRYCRVWMSLVKWWLTQQAFPRSAILTLIFSNAGSLGFSAVDEVLSNDMPDTSLLKMSLRGG